jgi:hypothetical protein
MSGKEDYRIIAMGSDRGIEGLDAGAPPEATAGRKPWRGTRVNLGHHDNFAELLLILQALVRGANFR